MDAFGNGDLWNGNCYPDHPGFKDSETSLEAAEAVAPDVGRLQKLTLDLIASRAAYGATAEEAALALDMPRTSIQPRVSELLLKGLIVDSGLRRRNPSSGKRAKVWTTPEHMEASSGEAE